MKVRLERDNSEIAFTGTVLPLNHTSYATHAQETKSSLKARGMANIAKNGKEEVLQPNSLKVFKMILSFRNQGSQIKPEVNVQRKLFRD